MYRHLIRYATRKLRMTQPVLQINFPNERSMWATHGPGSKVSHHPSCFRMPGGTSPRACKNCSEQVGSTSVIERGRPLGLRKFSPRIVALHQQTDAKQARSSSRANEPSA